MLDPSKGSSGLSSFAENRGVRVQGCNARSRDFKLTHACTEEECNLHVATASKTDPGDVHCKNGAQALASR